MKNYPSRCVIRSFAVGWALSVWALPALLAEPVVMTGDYEFTGGLLVDGDASAAHVSSVSASGASAFYGRQVGSGFANAQPIFGAVTDNTTGASNWFFRGKIGGDNGTETFSVRADGVIKSAALAPGGTANVLLAVTPDGTLIKASSTTPYATAATLKTGGLSVTGPVIWGVFYDTGNGVPVTAGPAGSMAGGAVGENGTITSVGTGSVAMGFSEGSAPILSSGVGSMAFGYQSGGIGIKSTGGGSFAVGCAMNGGITSSNSGSVAMGAAINANITASGVASFALGQDIQATADNAFALGSSFTNATPSTFKVGFNSTPTFTVTGTQVGIGTTAPTATLDVAGDAKVQGSLTVDGVPVLTNSGSGSGLTGLNASQLTTGTLPVNVLPATVVQSTATQTLSNKTLQNTTLAGTTSTLGNVGIGTTTPAAPLEVVTSSQDAAIRVSTANQDFNSVIDFYYQGESAAMRVGFNGGEAGDALVWNYKPSNILLATNNIERFRIDPSGNVGIGTSTPAAKLDVSGDVRVAGMVTVKTKLRIAASGDLSMGTFNADGGLGNPAQ